MTPQHARGDTLDEVLLMRYLHGELDVGADATVAAHVAECADCRARTDALERRLQRVGDALRAADFEMPPREDWRAVLDTVRESARNRPATRDTSRLRLAAGLLLAVSAAALLASSPLRAWIADRLDSIAGGPHPAQQAAPTAAATAPADAGPGTATLVFQPDGAGVNITFDSAQEAGVLRVRFLEVDDGAHMMVTGGAAEPIAVRRSGIRVSNATASTASYDISVPRTVQRVTVRVSAHDALVITRPAAADTAVTTIDLGTGVVRNTPRRDDP